jgi:hypothetical protein
MIPSSLLKPQLILHLGNELNSGQANNKLKYFSNLHAWK